MNTPTTQKKGKRPRNLHNLIHIAEREELASIMEMDVFLTFDQITDQTLILDQSEGRFEWLGRNIDN